MNKFQAFYLYLALALLLSLACTLPFLVSAPPAQKTPSAPASPPSPSPSLNETADSSMTAPAATDLPGTNHLMKPADNAPRPGLLIYDPDSSGTGLEKRAPYGDSYQINRFERPFLQDMTYVPDMDIVSFNLSGDADWYYVSIELIGNNPNNVLGIHYGVEIDLNADGFGDYIVWAHPPYTAQWDTSIVKVFKDSNHDTGGLSGEHSDAVLKGDGYETLAFDGGSSHNTDPDLAWARIMEGSHATIQFAFKRSWIGSSFMFGVVSDAGHKDVSMYDYNDRFTEAEAGSPIRSSKYYPLGALYTVDNTCWEPYGLHITGYEPKICAVKPTNEPGGKKQCHPNCGGGPYDPDTCQCQ